MVKKRICCIFNYAPHYRLSIYQLMEDELQCDFYFGNKLQTDIKKFDYSNLINSKELRTVWFFKKIYWIKGSLPLIFKPYKKYLLTGQINCLSDWLFLILAKSFGKDVYIWNHGWYGNETRFRKIVLKIFNQFVKGFFLYGNYAKNLMIAQGFDKEKLNVVYNSLHYEQILKIRSKLHEIDLYEKHFGNQFSILIFVGRLQPVKRLEMILEVIQKQKEKGIIYNLVFVGSGDDEERLKKLAKIFSIEEQIWFYGPCYDEKQIGFLFYNADLCVSPGNVGLTAIHALSYGTPVITHDDFTNQMPEFEAIIPGITGKFFKHNDLESLQLGIADWLIKYPRKNINLINACYKVIDSEYNPNYQIQVMKGVLMVQ